MNRIKVIIADDNRIINNIIKSNLEMHNEIEVLGSCYSEEEEISMIECLKPEIVITDLARNGTLSGLEIIKKYKKQSNMPKFLVVTAGGDELIDTNIIDGLIKKPFVNVDLVFQKIKNIKEQIEYERLPKEISGRGV